MTELGPAELTELTAQLRAELAELTALGQRLDLTRGKPSAEQLDLSDGLLALPSGSTSEAGTDTRNYGGLEGLAELRSIFAELLGVDLDQIVAGGNASLSMMRDVLVNLWLKGAVDGERPWGAEATVKSSARCPATIASGRAGAPPSSVRHTRTLLPCRRRSTRFASSRLRTW